MFVKEQYEKEKAAKPGRKMMGRLPNGKMVELIPGKNGKLVPIGELIFDSIYKYWEMAFLCCLGQVIATLNEGMGMEGSNSLREKAGTNKKK